MKPKSTLHSFLAIACSAALTICYAHSATTGFNVDTAGPHDYNLDTNWVSSTINGIWDSSLTLGADQTITFGADTVLATGWAFNYDGNFGLTLRGSGANRTVTLGGDISVNPVADQTITIGSGTANQNLNVNLGGVTRSLTVNANKGLTFVNVLSNGGLAKTGTGTLTLSSNASTYSGQLTVAQGTLSIPSINNVSANGTLGNNNALLPVILGSSGGNTGALRYTGGNGSSSKTFTFAAGGTGEINVSTGATTLTLSGLINGGGGLSKTGAGTLTLSANGNEFTGNTVITSGKVALGAQYALWKSAYDTTGSTGTIGLDRGTQATPWLGGLAGSVNLATAITGYSGITSLVLNPQSGSSVSYGGVIANGAANMALNKTGHGIQTLTGANTYSGATTVWAGTLALSGASGTALNSAFTVRGGPLLLDNTAALANRLNDATALSLGSLTLKANSGGGTQSETVGDTTFAVGGKVTVDLNGGTDQTTLAMGGVTRSAGAAINFVGVGGTLGAGANSPNVTSTGAFPNASNGILPWATVGGTQWAEDNAGSIRAYSGTFEDPTTAASDATKNAQLSGSGSIGSAKSFNSLNVIATGAGQSLDLNGNLTLTSGNGAILKSGAEAYTISATSGNITAGSQLIAHVDGGALTISAPLNTAILNLAKGGTGDLILSGTRAGTMNGAISIAGGQLEFQGNSTTLSGVITGAGGLTVNLNAGQILTMGNNSNSYAGPTIVKGGYLASPGYNQQGMPGGLTITPTTNSSLIGSNLILEGGIFYASYVFDKNLGDGPGQVQILGGTSGFVNTANSGGAASFKLDSGRELVWGSTYFNPTVFVHSQNNGANLTSTLANGFDLNGSTRTIMVGDATYNGSPTGGISAISGVIRTSSGTAGLTKTGPGTLQLSGVNTYNGNTTVNAGVLLPNTVASLPGYDSPGKVVFNGGTISPPFTSGWTTAQVDTLLSNATKTSGSLGFSLASGSLAQWSPFTSGNLGALGLNKSGTGTTLILNQANTYTGGTTISGGTLIFQKLVSMPASGVVAVQTGGTIGIGLGGVGEWTTGASGEGTLGGLLAGLGGQVGSTVSYTGNVGLNVVTTGTQSYGAIANVGSSLALTKSGTGSLTLTGTNAYTGATTLSGGTLVLDYDTTDNTKLANGAGLNLNGGTLNLKGGTHLEVVSGTNLNAGHTAITRDGGVTAKLRMNALNRASGGTISFADATIADTDRINTNGILGGYAIIGNDWATSAASGTDIAVTALASYTGALPTTGGAAADNDTLTGDQTQTGAAAANTVKIANNANSQTLDLGGNNLTITSTGAATLGGIMYVGGNDNNYSITGTGRIVTSGGNQEILFAVNTGTLSVSAFVGVNNSSNSVTKYGAGTLVLSAANNYNGVTRVNEGTLALGANNVFRNDTPFSIGNATLDAATFDDTVGNLDVTDNATINLGAGANLAFASSSAVEWTGGTLTLTGTLDFGGGATSSLRFGTNSSGLTATQLASITAIGYTNFALNGSGYLTADVDVGSDTFADWIDGFSVGGQTGIDDDYDNDNIGNAVENLMGTSPAAFNQGLTSVSSTGANLKFRHTLSTTPASDLTGAYEWSVNLSNWNADGATSGGTTVSFGAPVIITPGTPNLVEVTATVSGTPSSKIFARFKATQD
jgi:autotransporter-associated beta strand protein